MFDYITRSFSIIHHSFSFSISIISYFDFTLVHAWSYIAKKGLVSVIPRIHDMKIDYGFTIEAYDDDEMPECILGSACVKYLDPLSLPQLGPDFI